MREASTPSQLSPNRERSLHDRSTEIYVSETTERNKQLGEVEIESGETRGAVEKILWATGAGFEAAEQIFNAAKDYVLAVEQGVGKDPQKTMPWFFDKDV